MNQALAIEKTQMTEIVFPFSSPKEKILTEGEIEEKRALGGA